jgi:hypothetical protein
MKGLPNLSAAQGATQGRPYRGPKGYAEIKPSPGTEGYAANNPAEHGPYESAYPYAQGLSIHTTTFLPFSIRTLYRVPAVRRMSNLDHFLRRLLLEGIKGRAAPLGLGSLPQGGIFAARPAPNKQSTTTNP